MYLILGVLMAGLGETFKKLSAITEQLFDLSSISNYINQKKKRCLFFDKQSFSIVSFIAALVILGSFANTEASAQTCNERYPFVNGATFDNLVATSSTAGICVPIVTGISNTGHAVDADLTNFTQIDLSGIGCSGSLRVVDTDAGDEYPIGTFAGFRISSANLLSVSVAPVVTIKTYNNGSLVESFVALSSLVSINASLINGDGTTTVGFITSQAFDGIEITYQSTLGVLNSYQVYHPVIQEFCAGPSLDCNMQSFVSTPDFPAIINTKNTGISGLACVGCSVVNTESVLSSSSTDFATITLTAAVGSTVSLAVEDVITSYPSGTFAGFDILNSSLVGVDLLSGLTVRTYLNGTFQESSTSSSLVSVTSSLLTGTGRQTVGFVSSMPFDQVKLEVTNLLGLLNTTRVYALVLEDFCPATIACDSTYYLTKPNFPTIVNGSRTGITGLACVACSLTNSSVIIDSIPSNFSTINMTAGIAATGRISVQDQLSEFPAGSTAGVVLEDVNNILQVDLFNSLSICTYLNGVQQECSSSSELIDLAVLANLIGTGPGIYNLGFKTSLPYDEIQLNVGSLASVLNTINVHAMYVDTRGAYGSGFSCVDTDGDGVADIDDLDDDNDGILDSNESACGINGTWTNTTGSVWESNLAPDFKVRVTFTGSWGDIALNSNQDFNRACSESSFTSANGPIISSGKPDLGFVIPANLASTNTFLVEYFDGSNNPIAVNNPRMHIAGIGGSSGTLFGSKFVGTSEWAIQGGLTMTTLSSDAPDFANNGTTFKHARDGQNNGVSMVDCATGEGAATIQVNASVSSFTFSVINPDGNPDGIKLLFEGCGELDYDLDGIANQFDLDSDGDGCPDALEGAGTFIPSDLQISTMNGGNTGGIFTGTGSPVYVNLTGDLSLVPDPVASGIINANGLVTQVNGISVTAVDQGIGVSRNASIKSGCYAPVAVDDDTTTIEDTPVTINILANDSDIDGNLNPSSIDTIGVLQASNGTLTILPSGEIIYTPNLNFNGTDTFEYIVCDENTPMPALCDTAIVTVTVTAVNDAILVMDDDTTTLEDTPVTIAVLSNDADVDGNVNPASVDTTGLLQASNGTVGILPTGEIVYTPNLNFNGTDTFQYKVCDDGSPSPITCDTAMVTVTVTAVNDAILVMDDDTTTLEDIPVTIAVLSNDTDVDGNVNPASIDTTGLLQASNGTLAILPSGEIVYTPNLNFNGTDTFQYKVCDDGSPSPITCDTAMVTVTVTAVNDAILVMDDDTTTLEDTPVTIAILSNDTDVDGNVNPASVDTTGLLQAINGTVAILPSGEIVYTPNLNFNGTDTFQYKVCDDGSPSPITCDTAMVTVTVTAVNDAILVLDDDTTTLEDTPVTIAILSNDTDVDGNVTPASVDTTGLLQASNGTIAILPSGEIVYTPNLNFNGTDTFQYMVCDDGSPTPITCDTALVTVTVTAVNDAILVMDDDTTTLEDTPVTITVLSNDTDVDGNVNPASIDTTGLLQASNGTIAILPTGEIVYTPNLNFNGTDTFQYKVCDDGSPSPITCDTAMVTVTVTAVNDAIMVMDDDTTTLEDTPVTIAVLSNDTDVDGNVTPASVDTTGLLQASNGTIAILPSGEIVYTPNLNFNGTDTFQYRVCDDGSPSPITCDTAMVTVIVSAVNDAILVMDDDTTTLEDTPVTIAILSNDTDVDGNVNPASIDTTGLLQASNGMISILLTGEIVYTPNLNFNGTDTFQYRVCDDGSPSPITCDTAMVTVTVTAVNDAILVMDDDTTTLEDTPVTIAILSNDTDVDGNVNPASIDTSGLIQANNGTIAILPSGEIVYTPNLNFNGTDTFQYMVCDDGSPSPITCDTAMVTVTVSAVNDAILVMDDDTTTLEDTPVTIAILSNDTDVDGNVNPASVDTTGLLQASNGTIAILPSGEIVYTPNLNFNGTDTFQYRVCDDGSPSPITCDTAMVTVTVTAVNDAILVMDDDTTTLEDTPVTIAILSNDTDVDGNVNPASVDTTGLLQASNGTVSILPTGEIVYTPNLNFNGTDTFQYKVCDDGSPSPITCDTAMVTVTVSAVNDAILVMDDDTTTLEDTPVTIAILSNDTDVDGNVNPASVDTTGLLQASNGTIAILPSGEIVYTPNLNFNGTDTFQYKACDDGSPSPITCDTAMVSVTVIAVNDAPVAKSDSTITNFNSNITFSADANDFDLDSFINPSSVDLNPSTLIIDNTFIDNFGNVWSVDTNGDVTLNPADPFVGRAIITYTIRDNGGAISNVAELIVTVLPPNCQDVISGNVDLCPYLFQNPNSPLALLDCDGDGVSNGDECANGTLTYDPCSVNLVFVTRAATDMGDCDGDGVTNAQEINGIDGNPFTLNDNSNPNDPCDYNVVQQVFANTSLLWRNGDCDGDGVTNKDELLGPDGIAGNSDGSDPRNSCDFKISQITLAITATTIDCDGDGVPNKDEILGPDGIANSGDETNPKDMCSYDASQQLIALTSFAWRSKDCDGDGVLNYNEILGPDGIIGTSDDTNPKDACSFAISQITVPVLSTLDCDGDGVPNIQELGGLDNNPQTTYDNTDPFDACDFNKTQISKTVTATVDCDNDSLTNAQEAILGTDPFDPDTDGDGLTDGEEVTGIDNPSTPLSPIYPLGDINPGIHTSNPLDKCDPIKGVGCGPSDGLLMVKVMLQGAMFSASDGLMRANLNAYLPTEEPYTNIGGKFNHIGGGGGETTTTGVINANAGTPNAIVDWVLVELRSASNNAQILHTASGLVQRDGDVVSMDGLSPLTFIGLEGQEFYVAVKHRNHLGVMTAATKTLTSTGTTVDFTTMTDVDLYHKAIGINDYTNLEMATMNGKRALWAGNTNGDAKVKYEGPANDRIPVFVEILGFINNANDSYNYNDAFGYYFGDVNMDGKVKYEGPLNDNVYIFSGTQNYQLAQPTRNYNYNDMVEQLP
ncbi:hypothetical protein SAMN06298216_1016 [Spirosomataceae bacterium TFI 002]|nr:hypothetical protein SAMN06298216_1016 [Spirosomataceae bacterium TFI 002]